MPGCAESVTAWQIAQQNAITSQMNLIHETFQNAEKQFEDSMATIKQGVMLIELCSRLNNLKMVRQRDTYTGENIKSLVLTLSETILTVEVRHRQFSPSTPIFPAGLGTVRSITIADAGFQTIASIQRLSACPSLKSLRIARVARFVDLREREETTPLPSATEIKPIVAVLQSMHIIRIVSIDDIEKRIFVVPKDGMEVMSQN